MSTFSEYAETIIIHPWYRSRAHEHTSTRRVFASLRRLNSRTSATRRRLLRTDVRVARLDHRIGLAARRVECGGSCRPGVGALMVTRSGDALAARPRVR